MALGCSLFQDARACRSGDRFGRVEVKGSRVKRSKQIEVGDTVEVRLGPYEHRVVVKALSERRGPASVAASLFEEVPESKAAREDLQFKMKASAPAFGYDSGRPTKKERRDIEKLRGFNAR